MVQVESIATGPVQPLPLAGEVAPKARVGAFSSGDYPIAEIPSPQPSPASGREFTSVVAIELISSLL
jgi:hypothetical protein